MFHRNRIGSDRKNTVEFIQLDAAAVYCSNKLAAWSNNNFLLHAKNAS
jgi:hypothetical protein